MIREISSAQSDNSLEKESILLPTFSEDLQSFMSMGKSMQIDGTNVVRVPFGVRQPQKKRPAKPLRLATLVIPFQPIGSPTPPPQAA